MEKIFSRALISIFIVLISNISCNKEEGIGGKSSITGKVIERRYNASFTVLAEQYYATDVEVFIIYGDDPVYGDKVTTNYDGTYRFDYLREGSYKVFAYSEDSANYPTDHEIPIVKNVKITEKNQTVQADEIVILK